MKQINIRSCQRRLYKHRLEKMNNAHNVRYYLLMCSQKRLIAVLAGALLVVSASALQADDANDLIVVTNKDVTMASIDDNEIRRLFLGKSRRLPNGDVAALASYSPLRAFFNSRILGRSDTDVSRIWSRLKFSGRQAPPRTFNNVDAIVEYVKSTPNALAYLPSSYRRDEVRIMAFIPGDTPPLR